MNANKIVASLFLCLMAPALALAEFSDEMLRGLQGVGLEIRNLNIDSDDFELNREKFEKHVLKSMHDLDIRLLSDIELEVLPGQPFLEISLDLAHAQGPSHIYVVELELREMAQLKRPKETLVTMAVTTWERKTLGIANRPEAVMEMIDRLLRLFADELHESNI